MSSSTIISPTTAEYESFLERNLPFTLEIFIGIVLGCVAFVVILCVGIACICAISSRQKSSGSTQHLRRGRPSRYNDYLNQPVPSDVASATAAHPTNKLKKPKDGKFGFNIKELLNDAMTKQWQPYVVESDRLKLGDVLGTGQFGIVYKAVLLDKKKETSTDVAVKTVQGEDCSKEEVKAFLDEVIVMRGFNHKNVLAMIGLAILDEKPYCILPFMEKGDLKSYLAEPTKHFIVRDLLHMCCQVADGMNYLSQQGFVHRDLAARNCMVNSDEVIKIADFGLSRDIFVDAYYRMENLTTPLPVRWMAPESLDSVSKVFTSKSDVWSFGVLMWEVLNRGMTPYSDRDNAKVVQYVQTGGRLKQSPHIIDDVFTIMTNCWKDDPDLRPSFKEILQALGTILKGFTSKNDYVNVVNEKPLNKRK